MAYYAINIGNNDIVKLHFVWTPLLNTVPLRIQKGKQL